MPAGIAAHGFCTAARVDRYPAGESGHRRPLVQTARCDWAAAHSHELCAGYFGHGLDVAPPKSASRRLWVVYFCGADGDLSDGGHWSGVQYLPRYCHWPHDPVGGRGGDRVTTVHLLGGHHHATGDIGLHYLRTQSVFG